MVLIIVIMFEYFICINEFILVTSLYKRAKCRPSGIDGILKHSENRQRTSKCSEILSTLGSNSRLTAQSTGPL